MTSAEQIRIRWAGQNLAGQSILLYGEQGLGVIQYARYVPLVARGGARAVLACQRR